MILKKFQIKLELLVNCVNIEIKIVKCDETFDNELNKYQKFMV
jgi:hypothetical protein